MEWLTELAQNREAPLLAAFAFELSTAQPAQRKFENGNDRYKQNQPTQSRVSHK